MKNFSIRVALTAILSLLSAISVALALYKQIYPPLELIGEVYLVPASVPVERVGMLGTVPEMFRAKFDAAQSVKDLLPDEALRSRVGAAAKKELSDYIESSTPLHQALVSATRLSVFCIRNVGSREIFGVHLTEPLRKDRHVQIQHPDGHISDAVFDGQLDLCDLRPKEQAIVFEWGMFSGLDSGLTLAHRDGVGQIWIEMLGYPFSRLPNDIRISPSYVFWAAAGVLVAALPALRIYVLLAPEQPKPKKARAKR